MRRRGIEWLDSFFYTIHKLVVWLLEQGDAWGDGITTYNSPCGNVDDTRDGRVLFVTLLTFFKGYFPRWLLELQWGRLGKLLSEFTSMVLCL